MGWGLKHAVGLNDDGTQCPNIAMDQQQVGELLDAVARLPQDIPFRSHVGTTIDRLPPIEDALASGELCEAIRRFQAGEGDLDTDARVDVNGATWGRLIALVDPDGAPPGPVPVMLSMRDMEIVELPRTASGLPAVTYSIRGEPIAVFAGPGIEIELTVLGPIKVSWEGSYPVACTVSPEFAALEAAVASGAARAIGASAFSSLCSRLELESKAAVGSLFASISLSIGVDGTAQLTGSIGNGFTATSMSFDPIERSITYSGDITVFETRVVTGGDATLSGKLRARIKITTREDAFEASIAVLLTVAVAGAFLLAPVIAGLGIEASVPAVSEGVKDVVVGVAPAFAL
jgi:hypothetical protein